MAGRKLGNDSKVGASATAQEAPKFNLSNVVNDVDLAIGNGEELISGLVSIAERLGAYQTPPAAGGEVKENSPSTDIVTALDLKLSRIRGLQYRAQELLSLIDNRIG